MKMMTPRPPKTLSVHASHVAGPGPIKAPSATANVKAAPHMQVFPSTALTPPHLDRLEPSLNTRGPRPPFKGSLT
jgi:hypothetical protein